jgi:D-alanine transfer protein
MFHKSHLLSGLVAILCATGILAAQLDNIHSQQRQTIHAIARITPFDQEWMGDAFQRTALQQNDLLLIYGSSEVTFGGKQFGADAIFKHAPTGFIPFDVAHGNMTSLDLSQNLAAMGRQLRGKKVVISFTPNMFFKREVSEDAYLGSFSRLHALELVYSDSLSMDLKRRIARRMVDYPRAFHNDPFLKFGARALASDHLIDRMLYSISYPLGRLEIEIIQAQDDHAGMKYVYWYTVINDHQMLPAEPVEWTKLLSQAEAIQIEQSARRASDVTIDSWVESYARKKYPAPGSQDLIFLDNLRTSREWQDFDALLQVLYEEGAQPLILSRPINGPLYDRKMGVSAQARAVYYQLLEQEVQKYGFLLVDYREHDMDKDFCIDSSSHSSPKGWVYVDQTLDDYFHNRLVLDQ